MGYRQNRPPRLVLLYRRRFNEEYVDFHGAFIIVESRAEIVK